MKLYISFIYHWLFLIGLLILDLTFSSFKYTPDRNKTDLHRFKPNSCNTLNQRTVEPLKTTSFSGCIEVDIEVTSWKLEMDSNFQLFFIPTVLFIRFVIRIPIKKIRSLKLTFVSTRLLNQIVKHQNTFSFF